MSAMSEETPNPPVDLDSLYPSPRRTGERAEPRLAAVSDAAFARTQRVDTLRPAPAPGDRLEAAMSEFVRRQIRPEAMPAPVEFKRESKRGLLAASAIGIAAAVAIASFVALLFVTVFPRDKDVIQSFAAAVPPANSASTDAKAPLPQNRALVAENDRGQAINHEQSERLLQQFVQWRQKAALTDKP
jgi:hypothetical protein